MRVRLLLNPQAGRGRGARLRPALARLAAAAGLTVIETASAADLAQRAAAAAAEGVERLLVAGGDGSWHHAARSLAGTPTALAPLPAGTGNDLVRSLGLPRGLAPAFAHALAGPVAPIDLGEIDGETFCGVAGAGFDGAVAEHARTRLSRLRGPAVYVWATLATLARFRPPQVTVESDNGSLAGAAYLVAFANTPYFGGGMRIAPAADPTDGLLELVAVRRISKLRLLALFPRVYAGRHLGHAAVEHLRVARAVLRCDSPQALAGDGEGMGLAGPSGRRFAVRRGALGVVRGDCRPPAAG
jgi:diacylglycerol kinase (ATP)